MSITSEDCVCVESRKHVGKGKLKFNLKTITDCSLLKFQRYLIL